MESFLRIICCLCLVSAISCQHSGHSGPGSTKQLPDIFPGRCEEYQALRRPNEPKVNCTNLWDAFVKAFAYKDACSVTVESYTEFLSLFYSEDYAKDKSLFWSGVYDLTSEYTQDGKRYVAIKDTFPGHLADSLNWCGQQDAPGIDFEHCPTRSECGVNGGVYRDSFWGAASKRFAQEAQGVVTLFLNGTRHGRQAFETTSYFARYELPNLDLQRVSLLSIIVIQDLEDVVRETCSTGSLPELFKLVEQRGIPYKCEETPSVLRHFLCVDNPDSSECVFQDQSASVGLRFGGSLAVTFLLCMYFYLF